MAGRKMTYKKDVPYMTRGLAVIFDRQQDGGAMLFNGRGLTGPVARIPFAELEQRNTLAWEIA